MQKKFNDLSIRNKLLITHSLILLFLIISGVYSALSFSNIIKKERNIEKKDFSRLSLKAEMRETVLRLERLFAQAILNANNDILKEAKVKKEKFDTLCAELEDLIKDNRDAMPALQKLRLDFSQYYKMSVELTALSLKNEKTTANIRVSLLSTELLRDLEDLQKEDIIHLLRHTGEIEVASINLQNMNIIVMVFALLSGLIVALWLTRVITEPLSGLVEGIQNISKGDLAYRIKDPGNNDEIGKLINSFNWMTESLQVTMIGKEELEGSKNALERANSELGLAYFQLKEAQSKLVQAEKLRMVGDLAGGVAHEVKNPLAIILQGIDYLKTKSIYKEEDAAMILKYMEDAVKRADKIVKGLLDFANITELTPMPGELRRTIEKSLLLVKHQFDKNKIEVITEFQDNIPVIKIDENRMEQVFVNIFLNSAFAMPDGGKIIIRLFAEKGSMLAEKSIIMEDKQLFYEPDETLIMVIIEDTGVGIPPEVLKKLFEPFVTSRRGKGGTGLGLPVVRNFIRMHNGTISIKNKTESPGVRVSIVLKVDSE